MHLLWATPCTLPSEYSDQATMLDIPKPRRLLLGPGVWEQTLGPRAICSPGIQYRKDLQLETTSLPPIIDQQEQMFCTVLRFQLALILVYYEGAHLLIELKLFLHDAILWANKHLRHDHLSKVDLRWNRLQSTLSAHNINTRNGLKAGFYNPFQ